MKLPAYRYRIDVIRVIDGDTIEVDADLGFYTRIRTKLRLYGINCPELSTNAGGKARAFVLKTLVEHDSHVTADTIKADKYGNRWDAVVWLGDKSLNDMLLEAGLAESVIYK